MGKMIGVFFAFVGAGFADFSTKCHKITRKFRTSGIKSATECADVGAVAAEFNTGCHVVAFAVTIAHVKAGGGAAFAGFGALETRIDVVVIVLHGFHKAIDFIC